MLFPPTVTKYRPSGDHFTNSASEMKEITNFNIMDVVAANSASKPRLYI